MKQLPGPQGLYHPSNEHDSCGVAFVVDMHGRRSRDIVEKAITALVNLEHRGAAGSEPNTGDGAGILLQVPDKFFRAVVDFALPAEGAYATGIAFLPQGDADAHEAAAAVEKIVVEEGLKVLGWREVGTDDSSLGALARDAMPTFRQIFIGSEGDKYTGMDLERRAYVVRKRTEHELGSEGAGKGGPGSETVYFPSLSGQTFVYKGMLTTPQLKGFYLDLQDDRVESALGLVHSRFSTNTFPSWPLAHPFRRVAHNGEINTVTGNENWMRARESLIDSDVFGGRENLEKIFPICTQGASDTARFDEVLEMLHLAGRSLPHAVLMMIPEAWEKHESMDPARRAFYEYHSALMEPWDGPASVCFTDGTVIGAVLDRNGLRPSRLWITEDGLVVMASEVGVLPIDPSTVVRKVRLQPGRMFLVDTAQGRVISDEELKNELAAEHPYQQWIDEGLIHMDDLPDRPYTYMSHERVVLRQQLFGFTNEEVNLLVKPMALSGAEALGSMGTDTPIAVLSSRPRMLFDYFSQLFAQVTNPPLDAIREEVVTSLGATIGPEGDLLHPNADSCKQIALPQPILHNDDLSKLVHVNDDGEFPGFRSVVIRGLYPVKEGGDGIRRALEGIKYQVSQAIEGGARIVVLSDRESTEDYAPIPSLLLTSAVHHHLVREKSRTKVGLIVEAGDAREVHHMALLIGFGAAAVNPYMAFETIDEFLQNGELEGLTLEKGIANYIKAAGKGVLKVMSKMGVSTAGIIYRSANFRGRGPRRRSWSRRVLHRSARSAGLPASASTRSPPSVQALCHARGLPKAPARNAPTATLEPGGEYQWRREGEYHLFNPDYGVQAPARRTHPVSYDIFKEYTTSWWTISRKTSRRSARFVQVRRSGRGPRISIEEVEAASAIVRRFSTGAMSIRFDFRRSPRDSRHRYEPSRRKAPIPARVARIRRASRRLYDPRAASQCHKAGCVRDASASPPQYLS